MEPDEILAIARSVIARESATIASLDSQLDDRFLDATRILANCSGHVLVAGAGTSHATALRLAHLLTCCGTPALFVHPGDSQHGLAGTVTARDVVIAISKGGETNEVLFLAQYARQRGAKLIAFTENLASSLASIANAVLLIRSLPGSDPFGYIATGSSLTTAAMGDALCEVLLKVKGYTLENFAATHPGGAVGKQLQNRFDAKDQP